VLQLAFSFGDRFASHEHADYPLGRWVSAKTSGTFRDGAAWVLVWDELMRWWFSCAGVEEEPKLDVTLMSRSLTAAIARPHD
jgi:hypothetical protein